MEKIIGQVPFIQPIGEFGNMITISKTIFVVHMTFGVTSCGAASVVKAVRKVYPKTMIVKLSPNVTDIAEIAKAVEAEGADSVSLINTLLGMAVNAEKRKPELSTITGGLSGPCVKPIALRMVWQVFHEPTLLICLQILRSLMQLH